MYEGAVRVWQTPGGHEATFHYRTNSSDWNTVQSVMEDEYNLPSGLTGWAMDLGAHIGPVTVALALDNPALLILAVEPVPDNVRLLRANIEANGIADRVIVVDGAIAAPGDETVPVWYGYRGSVTLEHHAFIGNNGLAYDDGGVAEHEERLAPAWSLSRLLDHAGTERVAWLKVDTEGGEWAFLTDPAIARVDVLLGEWHNVRGHVQQDIVDLLGATHRVTFSGPVAGPGGFVAVRR